MYSVHAIQASDNFCPSVVHRFVYFDVEVIRRSTDLWTRRSLVAAHNKLQHAGSAPSVGESMATFCTQVAQDKASKKTVSQLIVDAFDHASVNGDKVCLNLLGDMLGDIVCFCRAPFLCRHI